MLSAVVFAFLGLAVVACGNGGRGSYVKANERLFASLPMYPGAKLTNEVSSSYGAEESGRVLGYVTRFDFTLPSDGSAAGGGWSFFRRRLAPDWLPWSRRSRGRC